MNFGRMRTLNNEQTIHAKGLVWAGMVTAALTASATALQAQVSTSKQNGQAMRQTDSPTMSDQNIADAVRDELILDHAVPAHEIDVSIDSGIVTLQGTVSNILAKDRATRIAETVKGIRGVVNLIEVDPVVELSGSTLRQRVLAALASDPAAESYELRVQADGDGVVTLRGTVDSWQEKILAATVTKGVTGVTKVRNEIEVEYEAERSDYDIRADVERALTFATRVDDALIDVSVNDGVVTLSGTVGSAAEKTRAYALAWVTGVDDVNTEGLHVRRWARDEDLRGDKYVPRTDAEVASAIGTAMRKDPRVSMFEIDATVDDGTVTLRGTVDNLKAKRAAERDAHNIVGVHRVINRIDVRTDSTGADTTVARSVRSAIKRDPFLEPYEISVTASDGTVNLHGTVDEWFDKAHADDVASQIRGVQMVNNNLTVRDETWLGYDPFVDDMPIYDYTWYDYEPGVTWRADSEIREDINDELFWSPFVDADEVSVTVEDGIATLTGTVDTWAEYDAAAENAFEGGAIWVDNDLNVQREQ